MYLGGGVSLQSIFRALTGQDSQLAIVASTLTIALLFTSLRRTVQSFVDQRFYRGKYDAERTLVEFSTKLKDEPDLGNLSGDLTTVVRKTVQPAHVTLWLRPNSELDGRHASFGEDGARRAS